jgi:transketolase
VRISTGSLGQGLSVAVGMALAKKADKDDHTVYVNLGDGELQEGQNWEAIMFAAHHRLNNIIASVDYNKQQIDGGVEEIMGFTELRSKFEAFNWIVLEMDGHNMQDILETNAKAKSLRNEQKPIVILMKTDMGAGVDFMMGSHEWHGIAPNDDQLARALKQLSVEHGDYIPTQVDY